MTHEHESRSEAMKNQSKTTRIALAGAVAGLVASVALAQKPTIDVSGPFTVSTTPTDHATLLDPAQAQNLISVRLTVVGPGGAVVYREQGQWDMTLWSPAPDAVDGRYTWEVVYALKDSTRSSREGAGRKLAIKSGGLSVEDGAIVTETQKAGQAEQRADEAEDERSPEPGYDLGYRPGSGQPTEDKPAWPLRALAAIGDFLIPSAQAQNFASDVSVTSTDPDFLLVDTTPNPGGPNWVIGTEDSPPALSIGSEFHIHADAQNESFAIMESGGVCVSNEGECPTTVNSAGGDVLVRSLIPAIEMTDTDDGQQWAIFAQSGAWNLRDNTGGGSDAIVAEPGVIDNALFLSDNSDGGVGLGTSVPESHLHLLDSNLPDIRLDDGTHVAEMELGNDGTFGLKNGSNTRPFEVELDGASADSFVVKSSGNIGIGTDVPATPVDVNTDQVVPLRLVNSGQNNLRFSLVNTQQGTTWTFDNNGDVFRITQVGGSASGAAFRVFENGDGRFAGDVFANGVMLTSARSAKTDFEALDHEQMLARVSELEVAEWRYKNDSTDQRHIGPFAEDFQQLFGVGDGKHISAVDFAGVSLSSIKALGQQLREKDEQIAALRDEFRTRQERLREQIADLRRRIDASGAE